MRKGTKIKGLRVIGSADGTDLGTVSRLLFDETGDHLLALVVKDRELFGMIDAQLVPFGQVRSMGNDAIIVQSSASLVKAHEDARLGTLYDNAEPATGVRVFTRDGRDLGALSDVFVEETSGQVTGYELSGGMFSDMGGGRRFINVPQEMQYGDNLALVPNSVVDDLEAQNQEPGGIKGAYASAKDKASETYGNVAQASISKQKEFVVGKVASRDVTTGAETAEGQSAGGESIVRQGETISQEHADRAESAGVLHSLVIAAGGTAVAGATGGLQDRAEESALGKPAGRYVESSSGSTIVAPGQIITQGILDRAEADGKKPEVIASAGLGGAKQSASGAATTVTEKATGLFEAAKEKFAELTGQAQEKKAEYDVNREQSQINDALGRPVTRVILTPEDEVILNTGDLITHKAVEHARNVGVLEMLFDSVSTAQPEITPEMMRARDKGQDALATQVEPTGGPITATQAPDNGAAQPA